MQQKDTNIFQFLLFSILYQQIYSSETLRQSSTVSSGTQVSECYITIEVEAQTNELRCHWEDVDLKEYQEQVCYQSECLQSDEYQYPYNSVTLEDLHQYFQIIEFRTILVYSMFCDRRLESIPHNLTSFQYQATFYI
ncbi:Hypothetical_protein [Hexamita inflata]|uniref:Hypothetical_protein n=1 Tax=Hexamita inflata TaxID=28002 RepID=A0AA86V2W3_9EUKA|nr:Hypothetical protein HINF_LOCUS66179 [Hexamita inflata]